MTEIVCTSIICTIIAKVACGVVGVATLLYFGWRAVEDYRERWGE